MPYINPYNPSYINVYIFYVTSKKSKYFETLSLHNLIYHQNFGFNSKWVVEHFDLWPDIAAIF